MADFHGTGLTVGPHPLAYRRDDLQRVHILSAEDLTQVPDGRRVRTAGCVIARQRPGTAKGFVFLSLEDETGISNAIITPDLLDHNRVLILSEKFLLLEGILQNQEGVVSIKVDRCGPFATPMSPSRWISQTRRYVRTTSIEEPHTPVKEHFPNSSTYKRVKSSYLLIG